MPACTCGAAATAGVADVPGMPDSNTIGANYATDSRDSVERETDVIDPAGWQGAVGGSSSSSGAAPPGPTAQNIAGSPNTSAMPTVPAPKKTKGKGINGKILARMISSPESAG